MDQDTKSAAESDEEIARFAHEMRNILTVMQGNLDLAKIQQKNGRLDVQDFTRKISEEVANLAALLDKLEK